MYVHFEENVIWCTSVAYEKKTAHTKKSEQKEWKRNLGKALLDLFFTSLLFTYKYLIKRLCCVKCYNFLYAITLDVCLVSVRMVFVECSEQTAIIADMIYFFERKNSFYSHYFRPMDAWLPIVYKHLSQAQFLNALVKAMSFGEEC